MAVEQFRFYNDLPLDLQEDIWKRVIDDFRADHINQHKRDLNRAPYDVAANQFYRGMDECLYTGDADYIQYRAIRDYLQDLADRRKLAFVLTDENLASHEILYSVGSSFIEGEDVYEQPKLLVSNVTEGDIEEPIWGDDDEYVPHSEIPPQQFDKYMVFLWVQCGMEQVLKFAINIDPDLVIENFYEEL